MMKKLILNLDELTVESFDTTSVERPRRGTIHGADVSDTTCDQVYCDCPTNGFECETNRDCPEETFDTCAATCGASCTFFCTRTCPPNTCAYTCGASCGCP